MTYETLNIVKDQRGVVYLELNRPEKRNALSSQMIEELTSFANNEGSSSETRTVVLSGQGKVFCAGGDLQWMHDQINSDRKGRIREAKKLAGMLNDLNEMSAPLIGKLHGGAFGGGAGLACVCDAVVADENTKFGFTETKLGLIPATISPYVIARMGEGQARRVFMSARIFNAGEAMDMGLVSKCVEASQLDEAIEMEIEPYLSVSSNAVGASKALARFLGPKIDPEIIDATIERLADTWETPDALEGIEAFLDKRPPKWQS